MKIKENQVNHLDDFIRLNEEWISTYFEIEDIDRKLAANPTKIIDDGGYIFSLVVDSKVIGVCALFNEGNGIFELARMAVSKKHRGNGYGKKLIEISIQKLKDIKAKEVYLVSNTKLKPAITLYEKHGFKSSNNCRHSEYSRANITMVQTIS